MKTLQKIVLILIVSLLLLSISISVILLLPSVQRRVSRFAEKELSQLLGTEVKVGGIRCVFFTDISIFDLKVKDSCGGNLLGIKRLSVDAKLIPLLFKTVHIENVQLIGLDANLKRDSIQGEGNWQFILNRFKTEKKEKEKKPFDFAVKVGNFVLYDAHLSYKVENEKFQPHRFSPHNMEVNHLNINISVREFSGDTLNAFIRNISFEEHSGLQFKRLSLRVKANSEKFLLTRFKVKTQHGEIYADTMKIDYFQAQTMEETLAKSLFSLGLRSNGFVLSDLSPLVPPLERFQAPLTFNCNVSGRLDSIRIEPLSVNVPNVMEMEAQGFAKNFTSIDSLFADLTLSKLVCYQSGIEKVLSSFAPNMKEGARSKILSLGNVSIAGKLYGDMQEGVQTDANLRTGIGNIDLNAKLSFNDTTRSQYKLSTNLKTESFSLSSLLQDAKTFGDVSFDLSTQLLKDREGSKISGNLEGKIEKFDFRGYPYSGILLNLKAYSLSHISGKVDIMDPHIRLNLGAEYEQFSNKEKSISLNLNLDTLHWDKLHLIEKYKNSNLSLSLNTDLFLDTKKELWGELSIDNLDFRKGKQRLYYENITAKSHTLPNGEREISLFSDFLKVHLIGKFQIQEILPMILQMEKDKLPTFITPLLKNYKNYKGNQEEQYLDYSIQIAENEKMCKMFRLPFCVKEEINLLGSISSKENRLDLKLSAPDLFFNKNHLRNVSLSIDGNKQRTSLSLGARKLSPNEEKELVLALQGKMQEDSISLFLHTDDGKDSTFMGELSLLSSFMENGKKLKTTIDFLPTRCRTKGIDLRIYPCKIEVEEEKITIKNFSLGGGEQYLKINGVLSNEEKDNLSVSLKNIDVGFIFDILQLGSVHFGGFASGEVMAKKLFSSPEIYIDTLRVKDLNFNHTLLGNAVIHFYWDNPKQSICFSTDILNSQNDYSKVTGYYRIPYDSLVLHFDAHNLQAKCLRPYLNDILQDLDGELNGKVSLFGPTKDLSLDGDAFVRNFSFGVSALGTRYSITDTVHFFREGLQLRENTLLYDRCGNTAIVNGGVRYTYFRDATVDFRLSTDKLLMYEQHTKGGFPLLGEGFFSGKAKLSVKGSKVQIGGFVSPEKGSHIQYIMSDENKKASQYKYITFVQSIDSIPEQDDEEEDEGNEDEEKKKLSTPENTAEETTEEDEEGDVQIDLLVDMNPNLNGNLTLSETSNDYINFVGSGGVKVYYSTKRDALNIYGTYTLEGGECSLNIERLITKKFKIAEGSAIRFMGGDFSNLNFDVSAIYNTTANITDLDPSLQVGTSRSSLPVQCIVDIGGTLSNLSLAFRINVPSGNSEINRKINSLLDTEDMMLQQVLYLLLWGRFYPLNSNSGTQGSSAGMAGILSSVVSTQLNNVLGSVVKNWNVNTKFKARSEDYADSEIEVGLSGQLLNNRLLVSGNFGYRDKKYSLSQNNFIGDIDVEYKLSPSGIWRAKAYTHSSDRPVYYKSSYTTQGLGISFKKEFDFFRRPYYMRGNTSLKDSVKKE